MLCDGIRSMSRACGVMEMSIEGSVNELKAKEEGGWGQEGVKE